MNSKDKYSEKAQIQMERYNEKISKIDDLLKKKEKSNSEGNLSKHFGKLKRNIDGLEYQLEIRKNED